MCNRGTIVIVSYPFTDLSSSKRRPALVVSNDIYNSKTSDVVLVALTSQMPRHVDTSSHIVVDQADLVHGTIPVRSWILISKLFTCDKSIIQKVTATVSFEKMSDVLSKIRDFFS